MISYVSSVDEEGEGGDKREGGGKEERPFNRYDSALHDHEYYDTYARLLSLLDMASVLQK